MEFPDSLIQYRKAWEEHVNQALKKAGRPERVDCRSYTEQGADTISGIHLGSHASRQKDSDRYQINEEIKALNEKNRGIRKTLDSLEAQIKEKSERVYEELAETLGRLEADIVSAKYSVEMLQEQVHQVTESRERLEGSVKRVRTARDTMKEKDRISQANIARFRKELEGKFPAWSSRPAELAQAIQAEQDSIRFRRERLSRILEEEGFADIPDFMQESQILEQMKREEERLTQGISAAQAQVEEYTSRYEELCKRIPTDSEQFQKFTSRKDSYSQQYRDKTADRIRHKSGNAHVKKFLRIAKETNYSLHHAYYLAGRTAYLMKQMQDLAEEQDGRRRR